MYNDWDDDKYRNWGCVICFAVALGCFLGIGNEIWGWFW